MSRQTPAGATATSKVQLPFTPYPHQRAAHAARLAVRFLVMVWHRRAGKTVFCIIELILAALVCRKERGRFGYIAPFLKQAKEIAWEYLKAFTAPIPGCKANESDLSITFANGARIRLYGADHPDSLRGGYFDGVIFDEYGDMKPQTWGEVVRPMLSDRKGWAIFIGTPKGLNSFSELYFRAEKGEIDWKAILLRWQDTGVIDLAEIESARREMSPNAFAQEYECNWFAAATNVLIDMERALAATKRDYHHEEYAYAAKVMGVDAARSLTRDRTVVARRQGLVAFQMREDPADGHVFRIRDTMVLASEIARIADNWGQKGGRVQAIFIDVTGVGAGIYDRLKGLGYPAREVIFGAKASDTVVKGRPQCENKRAEIWWDMAEWMRLGSIPNDQALITDLTAPTYTYKNARGKLQLESKEDMLERGLKSPDKGDALACTFAEPVIPIDALDGASGRGDHCVTEDMRN